MFFLYELFILLVVSHFSVEAYHVIKQKDTNDWIHLGHPHTEKDVTSAEECQEICTDHAWCKSVMFTGCKCTMYKKKRDCQCPADAVQLSPDHPSRYKVFQNVGPGKIQWDVAKANCRQHNSITCI